MLVCLFVAPCQAEEEAVLDDDNVRDVYAESTRQIQPTDQWIEGHGRPWWFRRHRWGSKTRSNGKRMKRKQHKRTRPSSQEFYYDDRLDHFVPANQWDEKQMDDQQPVRIRIRLRRRGPVKRHAKKSSKLSKKVLMEFAQDRELDSIAKQFLLEDEDDDSLTQVLREAVQTYRRADRLSLDGHQRQGLRVKVRRTKRRS